MSKIAFESFLAKRTVKNGIWMYGLQFFNTILPLVTLPYITRILGATQYGVFSIVLNFVSYLQVLVEYGFSLSATRKVVLANSEEDINALFTQVFCARLILFLLSFLITIGNVVLFQRSKTMDSCLFVLSISLIGYVFQENWIFQGKQEMKYISISTIIARSLTTILIFISIKSPNDIVLYCVLYSLSPIIANVIGMIISIKRYRLRLVCFSVSDLRDTLKDGLYIFFTQLSSKVFGAIGITFLGIFASEQDVGIYSAIYKIPYILMLLWNPIAQIIYPLASERIIDSNINGYVYIKKLERKVLLIFVFFSSVIAILSRPIIFVLFGEIYASHFYIVYPLLIWMLLGINNNFEGIQILVGSGHDKEYSQCFQISVGSTVFINFILIYMLGINGAALAPALSEALLAVLLRIKIKKIGIFEK